MNSGFGAEASGYLFDAHLQDAGLSPLSDSPCACSGCLGSRCRLSAKESDSQSAQLTLSAARTPGMISESCATVARVPSLSAGRLTEACYAADCRDAHSQSCDSVRCYFELSGGMLLCRASKRTAPAIALSSDVCGSAGPTLTCSFVARLSLCYGRGYRRESPSRPLNCAITCQLRCLHRRLPLTGVWLWQPFDV